MSTSVDVSPCVMSRLNRLHQPAVPRPPVVRSLWGPPENAQKLQTEEMHKMRQEKVSRWNFDFGKDKPLPGKLDWVPMKPATVPSFYRGPRLSLLLDERRECQETGSTSDNEKTVSFPEIDNIALISKPEQTVCTSTTSRLSDTFVEKDSDCSCSSSESTESSSNNLERSMKKPRESKITDFYRSRKRTLLEKSVESQPSSKAVRTAAT